MNKDILLNEKGRQEIPIKVNPIKRNREKIKELK
jgi:hypothetical protein